MKWRDGGRRDHREWLCGVTSIDGWQGGHRCVFGIAPIAGARVTLSDGPDIFGPYSDMEVLWSARLCSQCCSFRSVSRVRAWRQKAAPAMVW